MKKLLFIICLSITHTLFAQQIPELGISMVHITGNDKNIIAEVKPLKSDPSSNPSSYYYWYSAGIIHQTQGGYSGKLLNGQYNEYYLNKSLKEQGAFNKGLMNGVWKDWDENGNLEELYTYHNGEKTGLFNLYDEKGAITETGTYNKNQLDGKITFYSKEGTKIVKYKEGKVVPPPTHTFWDKFKSVNKIFKKKEKTAKPADKTIHK